MTLRLLVADDSVTIHTMVRLAFDGEDAVVEAVTSGEAALEALGRVRPDIVLADAIMPGLDGYALCGRIREHPEFGSLPVLLLCGTFEPFDPEEAQRVRADGHLSKPFDPSELIDRVHALVGRAAPTAAPPDGTGARVRESFLGPGAILDLFGPGQPCRGSEAARGAGGLTDEDVRRVAEEVVRRMAPEVIREVAWEVVPELAEVLVKRVVDSRDPEPELS
ncbi:MAG: response regulator [Acidobacteriota bacterium]|jgi:CheY-like chemotaxis protein|nr:response regulator [Acidobacteriota bacterium]NLT33947.1 response regulator [Acidobacteriota bacterium]